MRMTDGPSIRSQGTLLQQARTARSQPLMAAELQNHVAGEVRHQKIHMWRHEDLVMRAGSRRGLGSHRERGTTTMIRMTTCALHLLLGILTRATMIAIVTIVPTNTTGAIQRVETPFLMIMAQELQLTATTTTIGTTAARMIERMDMVESVDRHVTMIATGKKRTGMKTVARAGIEH